MDGPAFFHGRTVDGEKKTEAEGCLRDEWREPAIWPVLFDLEAFFPFWWL
jgi:hypothetical protein